MPHVTARGRSRPTAAFQPGAERLTATPAQQRAYQRAAVAWPRDPQGYHFGFGETKLPARDLAKVGYLYLNGGRWDTTQVVPADYVRASTQPHTDLPWLGAGGGYGYQWWTRRVGPHDSFVAAGFGGQRILVIPDLDLVVVLTTDAQQQLANAEDLVDQTITPAVTGQHSVSRRQQVAGEPQPSSRAGSSRHGVEVRAMKTTAAKQLRSGMTRRRPP